ASVECGLASLSPELVDNGDQGGPLRRRVTGAAELRPRSRRPVIETVNHGEARLGIGVIGHVRVAANHAALRDHTVLVRRLQLVGADAPAAAGPAGFTLRVALAVHE